MKTCYFLKRFKKDYIWFFNMCGHNYLKSVRYSYENLAHNINCYLTNRQIKIVYKQVWCWLDQIKRG